MLLEVLAPVGMEKALIFLLKPSLSFGKTVLHLQSRRFIITALASL